MSEYIEREAAEKVINKYGCGNGSTLGGHNGIADCIADEISKIPAADVALVRRGHWERYHEADLGWDEWGVRCSNCGLEVEDKDFTFPEKFCPNCGAWMD